MPANNLSENLNNLSNSPGYKRFLGMPIVGSVVSKGKNKQTSEKVNKENILVPRKLLNRLLSISQENREIQPLQSFDSNIGIFKNIYKVLRLDHDTFMKNMIDDRRFKERVEELKETRTKELIDALSGKKIEEERKRQVKKEIEELQKKLKELEEKAKKPEGGAPPPPTPTPAPVPPVGAKPSATQPTPTPAQPTPTAATQKPAPTPAAPPPPAAPVVREAPRPSAIKSPEAVQTAAGTAAKAIGVAGTAVSGALLGKEALAKNIAQYESTASAGRSFGGDEYNAYNKGTIGNKMIPADVPIDFSKMTISEYLRRGSLPAGDPNKLLAVGRYQIIPDTMRVLIKQLKIDPDTTYLTPTTQDYLFSKGLIEKKRKPVNDYITGKTSGERARNEAIMALAKEFASVGVPYDTIRVDRVRQKDGSIKEVVVKLPKGSSYYAGMGGNKAHNPPELVAAALDEDRIKNLKTQQVPPVNKTGEILDEVSKEQRDLKQQPVASGGSNITVLNTNNNVVHGSNIYEAPTENKHTPAVLANQYK